MDKTFDEAIAGIRTAERGVEVREDIAQGMEHVKQCAEEVTGQQQAALQAAQTATGAARTATAQASTATSKAAAAASSATAAAASQAAAKASETESAKNLQGTKEYFEQVRTITIGAQGWYATPEALKTAVPVGENGWWAVVGATDTIWTWDSDTGAWKDSIQKADLSDYYTREQVNRLFEAQKLADHRGQHLPEHRPHQPSRTVRRYMAGDRAEPGTDGRVQHPRGRHYGGSWSAEHHRPAARRKVHWIR